MRGTLIQEGMSGLIQHQSFHPLPEVNKICINPNLRGTLIQEGMSGLFQHSSFKPLPEVSTHVNPILRGILKQEGMSGLFQHQSFQPLPEVEKNPLTLICVALSYGRVFMSYCILTPVFPTPTRGKKKSINPNMRGALIREGIYVLFHHQSFQPLTEVKMH
jgi:hypothetical protein